MIKKNPQSDSFDDENFYLLHYGAGWVSMDNWGPNSNKSSFFITLGDADFMNELHVVFGKIMNGMNVLRQIEQEKTYPKGKIGFK